MDMTGNGESQKFVHPSSLPPPLQPIIICHVNPCEVPFPADSPQMELLICRLIERLVLLALGKVPYGCNLS